MDNLSAKKYKDRAKMAEILIKKVHSCGGYARIKLEYDRIVVMDVQYNAFVTASVDFDGGCSIPDTFAYVWNARGDLKFKPEMGNVNSAHFRKASRVVDGFQNLLDSIEFDLTNMENWLTE